MGWTPRIGLAVASLAAAGLGLLPASSTAASPRYRVSVVRDSAGIPHIRAPDFRSLGYGEGFSYAQDNACLFAEAIVTVRGQRTRYFGANGTAYYYSNDAADPNPKSDAFWKWAQKSQRAKRIGRAFDKRTAALFHGWAQGFNAYLRSGKLKDPSCKGEPWVRPISFDDLLLRGLQIEIGASSGRLISGLYDAQPVPSAGRARQGAAGAAQLDARGLRGLIGDGAGDSELGSNGLGFGSRGTGGKGGLLLANPHFPWRGVDRFWMAHLTVPGRYNAMGGTLGGLPMIGIGFNRRLAWTQTVSTGRRFVILQLKLAPGDPTSYLVGGKKVPMTRTTVRVAGHPHTFYGTRYGLIVDIPQAGYTWSAGTAYALMDANLDNGGAANQYMKMGRARNVHQLLRIEERGRGVPFFNTVAADSTGTALYADVGRYSNVPASLVDRCTPAGLPQLVFASARLITLDGSRPACVPKGLLPAKSQPRLFRKDYVENSNDSFWLANPSAPITGITPLIGLSDVIQGVRTRYGNLAVEARLKAGRRFSVPSLQKLWQSDVNYLAQLASKQLAQLCRAGPQVTLADASVVDISEACPVLDAYDATGNLDSRGAWLFAAYQRRAPTGATFWADTVDPSNPLRTPNQLNASNPQHLIALGEAVRELRAHGIPLDSGLRGVQVATRGRSRISIHGCGNCFQNINASNASSGPLSFNAPYGEVVQGSSMVLTIGLGQRGPHGEGILTYSQATDPTSPYFKNMTRLFSRKRWVPLRFRPAELARDHHRRVIHLPGVP